MERLEIDSFVPSVDLERFHEIDRNQLYLDEVEASRGMERRRIGSLDFYDKVTGIISNNDRIDNCIKLLQVMHVVFVDSDIDKDNKYSLTKKLFFETIIKLAKADFARFGRIALVVIDYYLFFKDFAEEDPEWNKFIDDLVNEVLDYFEENLEEASNDVAKVESHFFPRIRSAFILVEYFGLSGFEERLNGIWERFSEWLIMTHIAYMEGDARLRRLIVQMSECLEVTLPGDIEIARLRIGRRVDLFCEQFGEALGDFQSGEVVSDRVGRCSLHLDKIEEINGEFSDEEGDDFKGRVSNWVLQTRGELNELFLSSEGNRLIAVYTRFLEKLGVKDLDKAEVDISVDGSAIKILKRFVKAYDDIDEGVLGLDRCAEVFSLENFKKVERCIIAILSRYSSLLTEDPEKEVPLLKECLGKMNDLVDILSVWRTFLEKMKQD